MKTGQALKHCSGLWADPLSEMRLQGKVALVTGAGDSRSIGWGIAQALADEGADVVINDAVQPERLEQRAAELRSQGHRALAALADVSQPEQVEAMFERAVAEMGRIDIVASNAGVIRWEHFLDITPKNLRLIVNVNIKGNVYVCRAAAQRMIAQGDGGRIVITSSVQADMQFPLAPIYGATKHAMHIFVGCLALELAPHNITVNHIGPGWVQTTLNDVAPGQQSAEEIEANRQSVPLKRAGLTSEMGRAVTYYASSDGNYVTGTFLRVDGGLGIGKYSY
ncbi:MAG: SDR family oxidoreductase [Burkholderiales bacterium]|nr:SDR family oxidoreductase [Anaerolineae bacterium]